MEKRTLERRLKEQRKATKDAVVGIRAAQTDAAASDAVLMIELERVQSALALVMRYPGIREYLGSQVSEIADAALRPNDQCRRPGPAVERSA